MFLLLSVLNPFITFTTIKSPVIGFKAPLRDTSTNVLFLLNLLKQWVTSCCLSYFYE